MSDPEPPPVEPSPTPKTIDFLLAIFADLYRQEVAAEEDVHRTLPFFGTALGLVIASLAYAAARLPKWTDLGGNWNGKAAFAVAAALLVLAIVEAVFVLVFVSRAISRRNYQRIGPERELRRRAEELEAFYVNQGTIGEESDTAMALDMQEALLDSYMSVTPTNRLCELGLQQDLNSSSNELNGQPSGNDFRSRPPIVSGVEASASS
jgi:hypothetical protein